MFGSWGQRAGSVSGAHSGGQRRLNIWNIGCIAKVNRAMKEYRITKYNPQSRVGGVFTGDEWTSFGDIGKSFNNIQFTYEMYQKTENAYIDCCIEILNKAFVETLSVEQVEYYMEGIRFPSTVSDIGEIRQIISACLREQCWLKLTAKDFFIHFGYDYYMYIGSVLPAATVEEIAVRHGLFCELYQSPYHAM